MKKRYAMTLLEIMVVVLLIGLIGSVVGVNLKKSLDKGKYFKSTQAAERVKDILMLRAAEENVEIEDLINGGQVTQIVHQSGLIRDASKALRDGWGNDFEFSFDEEGELVITTEKVQNYAEAHGLHPN